MAYTPNLRAFFVGGITWYHASIEETSIDGTDTWELEGVPKHGRIVVASSIKSAGSATEFLPSFGRNATAAVDDLDKDYLGAIAEGPAAVFPNQIVNLPYLDLSNGTLFGASNVDAGADNNIVTDLLICTDVGLWAEDPALVVNYFTPQQLATGSWTTFTIPKGARRAYLFTADGTAFDARYNSDDNAVEKVPADTQWETGTGGDPLGADFDVEFKATAGTPFLGGFYYTRN